MNEKFLHVVRAILPFGPTLEVTTLIMEKVWLDETLLLLLSTSDKRSGSDVLRKCREKKDGLFCDEETLVGGEADWPRDERLKELEMRSRKEVCEERDCGIQSSDRSSSQGCCLLMLSLIWIQGYVVKRSIINSKGEGGSTKRWKGSVRSRRSRDCEERIY